MQEIEHVIQVLEKAKIALKEKDSGVIRDLSNETIHSASIYQDPDNISIAVILYALSKIIERKNYEEYKSWDKFEKVYILALTKAIKDLKEENIPHYRKHIGEIRMAIRNLSGNLKTYIDEVFRKAEINKASRLHEHGLSLEKTAKILGITLWELNQYVGQTGIADVNLAYTKDLNLRIKSAEKMFAK